MLKYDDQCFQKENRYSAAGNIEKNETSELTEREERVNEYVGQLELHIMLPIGSSQLSKFEKLLLYIPNFHILNKSGSDNGIIWFEVNCSQPLPVENLLQQVPPVK